MGVTEFVCSGELVIMMENKVFVVCVFVYPTEARLGPSVPGLCVFVWCLSA